MNKVIVEADQNIIDLALQECGSVEGLIGLLSANSLSLNSDLSAGQVLKLKDVPVINSATTEYFKKIGYKVNTGYDTPLIEVLGLITEDDFGIVTEDGQQIQLEEEL